MIGIRPFLFVSIIGLIYFVPLVAAIWALVTLRRIRVSQDIMQRQLNAIERLLGRSSVQ